MRNAAEQAVSWAHSVDGVTPPGTNTDTKRVINERLPFWRLVNDHVSLHGPLSPLKLLRHGSQSFYSKTKCGVDGATKYGVVLRSASLPLPWEQKLITQTIK